MKILYFIFGCLLVALGLFYLLTGCGGESQAAQGGLSSAVPFASSTQTILFSANTLTVQTSATTTSAVNVSGKTGDILLVCNQTWVSETGTPPTLSWGSISGTYHFSAPHRYVYALDAIKTSINFPISTTQSATTQEASICGLFIFIATGNDTINSYITSNATGTVQYYNSLSVMSFKQS